MQAALPLPSLAHPLIADVLATNPHVVAFDCDGTLWHGDAGEDFFLWSIGRGLVTPRRAKDALLRWERYRVGWIGEEELWGALARIYNGVPVAILEEAAADFVTDHLMARVYPEMSALLAVLAERDVEIWAVSASNHWVIAEACARLGIARDRVLATATTVHQGCATASVPIVPTDEGKARILRNHGVHRLDCAFGNTVHDFEMLMLARHGFAVNPEPPLLQLAKVWHWNIHRLNHR